jgi:hypothetical protein
MGPNLTGVGQATSAFADPANHAQIRTWHEQGMAFTDMIDALGLGPAFDPALRAVIDALSPDEVAIIREAMIAELDRVGAGPAELPVDCDIDSTPAAVDVTAIRIDGRPFARVTPSSP